MDCAVVITLWNGARWIRETLDAVFAQRHAPAEIVVVDDGSEDGSADVVRAAGRDVLLLRQANAGMERARNAGLARTRSPLVAFLDQDDLWHPRHLEGLRAACLARPEAPAAVSACVPFDDGGAPPVLGGARGRDGTYDPWEGFPIINRVDCPSAVLMRRDALSAAGGWDPRFTGVTDYHLWLLLSVRHPFARVAAATTGRRLHAASDLESLTSKRPIERLIHRRDAAEDALSRRPEVDEKLRRRRPLAEAVVSIAEALLARDRDGLRPRALAAEGLLAGDSAELRTWLFRLLAFSLCPRSFPLERRVAFWAFLLEAWPEEAATTHAALIDLAVELSGAGH